LGNEEKKRGQRLFGNLLGTLNRFTKEEKSQAASDRVSSGGTDVFEDSFLNIFDSGQSKTRGRGQGR
jgi:hypothetical protein